MTIFALMCRQDQDRILAWLRARGWAIVNPRSGFHPPGAENAQFSLSLMSIEQAVFSQIAHERVIEHPAPEDLPSIR